MFSKEKPFNSSYPTKHKIVTMGFVITICGLLLAQNVNLRYELNAAGTQSASLENKVNALTKTSGNLEHELANETELSTAKTKFLTVLTQAEDAMNKAKGILDINDSYGTIFSAQVIVSEEKQNVYNVYDQTKIVEDEIERINAAVTDWENSGNSQARVSRSLMTSDGGGLAFKARAALNAVTYTDVPMVIKDQACDILYSVACVSVTQPGVIEVTREYLDRDYDEWYQTMLHEYAHIIQVDNWDAMQSSTEYFELFKGDEELHADCMAQARMVTYDPMYGVLCTPEQVASATKAWRGEF